MKIISQSQCIHQREVTMTECDVVWWYEYTCWVCTMNTVALCALNMVPAYADAYYLIFLTITIQKINNINSAVVCLYVPLLKHKIHIIHMQRVVILIAYVNMNKNVLASDSLYIIIMNILMYSALFILIVAIVRKCLI